MVSTKKDNVLAVLSLSGGNDGIHTVIPYSNPLYREFRPALNVPEDQVLKLNDEVGLNSRYTEDDVKTCAHAFTGWNIAPAYPPFPYGRSPWEFRYDPADHDDSRL